jgi:hypothetical protein
VLNELIGLIVFIGLMELIGLNELIKEGRWPMAEFEKRSKT